MRAIHTVPHIGHAASGPSYSVPALGRALGAAGCETVLMTGRDAPQDPSPGFTHRSYPEAGFPAALHRAPALAAALAQEAARADVLHNHSMWLMANVYPGRAARATGTPLITAPRGCLAPSALARSPWRKRVMWHLAQRATFDRAACFHATSDKEHDEIRAFGLRGPVAVIPNGLDLPEPPAPRPRPGRTLVFLGRLHPIKGLDLLLEVWRDLPTGLRAGWQLRLVGPDEGGHRAVLEGFAARHGLDDVVFAGPAYGADKDAELAEADIAILPSKTENFGMAAAEALALGTPVIASRTTPWAGLETARCGWWAERSHAGLGEALGAAMRLPRPALDEMGARGRAWIARDFGWPGIAARMIDVYAWVIDGCRGAPPDCVRIA